MLIDTNVLSELRRLASNRMDTRVRAWASAYSDTTFYLSSLSILEVQSGILRRHRTDPDHAGILQDWLERQVLPDFAGRILPIDASVALACAPLHLTRTRPYLDSLIAATALVHDLPLATRNTRDFADTGVRLIDPWTYGGHAPAGDPQS